MSSDKDKGIGDGIGIAELHAYVDDQLDPTRRAAVHAYLSEHPERAAMVLDYQAINHGLRALYDPVLQESVPPRLRRLTRRRGAALAACALLLVGVGIGWLAHRWVYPPGGLSVETRGFLEQALLAHTVYTPEQRHAVEVPAEQEAHLVRWLSNRLGSELRAPRLAALGFELLGGRMLAIGDGPAAQFMYQDSAGRRLTLYARRALPATTPTAFQFVRRGASSAFYWVDRELTYALVGNIDRTTLHAIASAVYQQLSRYAKAK